MYPEEGRSAIAAAARAIADFRLGGSTTRRPRTSGRSRAGARRTSSRSGARSPPRRARIDERKLGDVVAEMLEVATFAASLAECDVETESERRLPGYRFKRDDCRPARRRGVRAHGPRGALRDDGRRADANVFNERGLQCVNLANGMAEIHTPDEHIAVADLDAMVEVTLALIDAARDVEP
jgi:tripeptide aminopeptidase